VPHDGAGIGEAHAASWEAAYGHIFDADFLARAAASRRVVWPHSLPRLVVEPQFVLVVELDGRIVGFANGGPDGRGRDVGEIYGFYTHPDIWGTGVATTLMQEACSKLVPDFDRVVVWTLRDAPQARRFYEKAGFRVTGGEEDQPLSDWTSGEVVERPAVEYVRSLASSE
jgi:GNAT superfamily N-acetyltransferase